MITIATSDPKVRRLRRLLKRHNRVSLVGPLALQRHVAKERPTVLILDLELSNLHRLDGIRRIQQSSSQTKFILITEAPKETEEIAALMMGVKGYCNKNITPSLMVKAVEMVQKGEVWAPRHLLSRLINEKVASAFPFRSKTMFSGGSSFSCLTPREREIVSIVAGGAPNREIASRLDVTESTVKAHLTSVFRKLEVADRLHLALLCTNQKRISQALEIRLDDGRIPRSDGNAVRNGHRR